MLRHKRGYGDVGTLVQMRLLGDDDSVPKAQVFAATGNKVGPEFLVNSPTSTAAITGLTNDGFVRQRWL